MRIGELTLTNQRILTMPWPTSYPFDGFLGADLFEKFVVTIDFARSIVTLTSPTQFSTPPTGELSTVEVEKRDSGNQSGDRWHHWLVQSRHWLQWLSGAVRGIRRAAQKVRGQNHLPFN